MRTAPVLDADPIYRAADALAAGKVHAESDPTPGVYQVASFSEDGLAYRVDMNRRSCSCPASRFQGQRPCKHLAALILALGVSG